MWIVIVVLTIILMWIVVYTVQMENSSRYYKGLQEALDGSGLSEQDWGLGASRALVERSKDYHDARSLLLEITPATDEEKRRGIVAYVLSRAEGRSHRFSLRLAVARASLVPAEERVAKPRRQKPPRTRDSKGRLRSLLERAKQIGKFLIKSDEL